MKFLSNLNAILNEIRAGKIIIQDENGVTIGEVTGEKIGNGNTAYTQVSKSKSYVIPIPLIAWDNIELEYVVEIPDLETSDTVILDGNNEIFAEYGLDAVIGAGTLKFSVGVKPSSSITIKCSIIKTEEGSIE